MSADLTTARKWLAAQQGEREQADMATNHEVSEMIASSYPGGIAKFRADAEAGTLADPKRRQFKVSAFPQYADGKSGDMCAYEEADTLPAAMAVVAKNTEGWLDAPSEDGEDDRDDLVGFEVSVELGSAVAR